MLENTAKSFCIFRHTCKKRTAWSFCAPAWKCTRENFSKYLSTLGQAKASCFRSFDSVHDLAEHLRTVQDDDAAFASHFWWREHYQVDHCQDVIAKSFCDLCAKLHDKVKNGMIFLVLILSLRKNTGSWDMKLFANGFCLKISRNSTICWWWPIISQLTGAKVLRMSQAYSQAVSHGDT